VVAILKMATSRNCSNNIAKIQHWPISSQFDIWFDNDVLNWFPTLKNFYRSPFSKCITKIQHCPISSQISLTYLERQICYGLDKKILFKKQSFDLEVKVPWRSLRYATHNV
jgi:hypothetical protein